MRQTLNFIIVTCIFSGAAYYFPSVIVSDSKKAVFIAAITFWVVTVAYNYLLNWAPMSSLVRKNRTTLVLSLTVSLIVNVIALDVLSAKISGFTIVGLLPKLIIAFIITNLTVIIKGVDYVQ